MAARELTAEQLVTLLKEFGASVVVKDGHPQLRLGEGMKLTPAMKKALGVHRAAVLEHFGVPCEPRQCGSCGALVCTEDPEVVFRFCGRVECPWWRPGIGWEWVGKARRDAAWRKRKGGGK